MKILIAESTKPFTSIWLDDNIDSILENVSFKFGKTELQEFKNKLKKVFD